MAVFSYKARDKSGKLVSGKGQAESNQDLAEKLMQKGYLPTNIELEKNVVLKKDIFELFKGISIRDLTLFSLQLSNMLSAGLPILSSLKTISKQVKSSRLREALDKVYQDVESGSAFSQALAQHPSIFSEYLVSLVKAGETAGSLPDTLNKFSISLEKDAEFKQKITSSLAYPLVVSFVAVAVVIFLMTFIMPQFIDVFQDSGSALPLATRILVVVSNIFSQGWYYIAGAIVVLVLTFRMYVATQVGRLQVDRFKLNLPILGKLFRKICVTRFLRTFATLYNSGVPILGSLKIVEESVGNKFFSGIIERIYNDVKEGQSISAPLQLSGIFEADVIMMVSSGEESGNLGDMLIKSADFYERDVDHVVKSVTNLIEPIIIVVMGLIVALIVFAVLLPIFKVSTLG